MNMEQEVSTTQSSNDFARSWVKSSRFLFYMQIVAFTAFMIGGSYALYKHSYKGKPDVKVPENTLYTPKYK